MNTIQQDFPKGSLVLARKPDRHRGRTTGGWRLCPSHGCTGIRMGVRWSDGKITWICSKSLKGNRLA